MLKRRTRLTERQAYDAWDNGECLILYEEDDARPPDREMADGAFERLSGHKPNVNRRVCQIDEGDLLVTLYDDGWFKGFTPEGGFVGLVVEMEKYRGTTYEQQRQNTWAPDAPNKPR